MSHPTCSTQRDQEPHGRRASGTWRCTMKSHLPTRGETAARFWSFSWEEESIVVGAYNAKPTRSPREAQPFLILPGRKFLPRTKKMLSNVQSHPCSKETAVSPQVLLYEGANDTRLQASVAARAQGLARGVWLRLSPCSPASVGPRAQCLGRPWWGPTGTVSSKSISCYNAVGKKHAHGGPWAAVLVPR